MKKNIEQDWIKEYYVNTQKLLVKLFQIGFIKISLSNEKLFYAYFEKQPQNFNNVKFVQINKVFANVLDCQNKTAPNSIN